MFSIILKAKGHGDNADTGSFLMDLKLVSNLLKSYMACEMTSTEVLLRGNWIKGKREIHVFMGPATALAHSLFIL